MASKLLRCLMAGALGTTLALATPAFAFHGGMRMGGMHMGGMGMGRPHFGSHFAAIGRPGFAPHVSHFAFHHRPFFHHRFHRFAVIGAPFAYGAYGSTGVMSEWHQFAANQQRLGTARPKLICIDLQPVTTTQAADRDDILNVAGFSDAVFSVVASFLSDDSNRFVTEVESIEL